MWGRSRQVVCEAEGIVLEADSLKEGFSFRLTVPRACQHVPRLPRILINFIIGLSPLRPHRHMGSSVSHDRHGSRHEVHSRQTRRTRQAETAVAEKAQSPRGRISQGLDIDASLLFFWHRENRSGRKKF